MKTFRFISLALLVATLTSCAALPNALPEEKRSFPVIEDSAGAAPDQDVALQNMANGLLFYE